jgi:hypothetical protein
LSFYVAYCLLAVNGLHFTSLLLHDGIRVRVFNLHSRNLCDGRHAVAQLVEALRTRLEGRGFDSPWFQWNFSLTYSFQPQHGPGVYTDYNINEYLEYFLGGEGGHCLD